MVIINIEQGCLKGTTGVEYDGRQYHSFLGIPYAKPPVGELRFKAPQLIEKWSGIKNATKNPSSCYQRDFVSGLSGTEDCLYLNVYTLELPEKGSKLKPVMVWIHGGAFTSGSNSTDMYGPQYLLTKDVVVVSINYRLGVLGFLAMDDAELEVPGNAGCKDMVLALKWVQKNIREFGGDPNNVTIFGESAGGTAVHLLVLSPMARGLFHKAIAQSGCALLPWSVGKPCYKELARTLECPHTDQKNILKYLQELPVETLFIGQEKMGDEFSTSYVRLLGPVVEKESAYNDAFLPKDPLKLILSGDYNKVPLIMGYTSHEGLFYDMIGQSVESESDVNFEKYVPNFFKTEPGSDLSLSLAERVKTFYLGDDASVNFKDKICALRTDTVFCRGIYSSVKHHAETSPEMVFFYRFSVDAGLNMCKTIFKIDAPGACHGDELGYLFQPVFLTNAIQPDSVEDKTIRRMVQMWTNFAATGNPNPVDGTTWRPAFKDEVNYLDIGEKLTQGENPEAERMKFWDELFSLTSETSNY